MLILVLVLAYCCIRKRRQRSRWQSGDVEAEKDEHDPVAYERPKIDSFIATPSILPKEFATTEAGVPSSGYRAGSSAGAPSIYSDQPDMRDSYAAPPVPIAATRPTSMQTSRPMSSDGGSQYLVNPYEHPSSPIPGSPSAASSGAFEQPAMSYPVDVKHPDGPGGMATLPEDEGTLVNAGPTNMADVPPIYSGAWASSSRAPGQQ